MTPLVVVLGLLYLAFIVSLLFHLKDERAENRRLRQENTRLILLMGERRGIEPPAGYAIRSRPPLEPAGPSAFRAKHVE